MSKKVVIDGNTIEQKLNSEIFSGKSVEVNFEEGPTIEWNDTKELLAKLPQDRHGVYIIIEDNECLYVGKTWDEKGFKGRISAHEKLPIFMRRADYISLWYIDKKATNEILLFERIKISQLEPSLNRDDIQAKLKSIKVQKETFELYNDYLNLVLSDNEILLAMENREIDDDKFQRMFLNKFNIIRREVDIDSFVNGNKELDNIVLTKHFCNEFKDTGRTEDSLDVWDYDCDCELGKNNFFNTHDYEQDEFRHILIRRFENQN